MGGGGILLALALHIGRYIIIMMEEGESKAQSGQAGL